MHQGICGASGENNELFSVLESYDGETVHGVLKARL